MRDGILGLLDWIDQVLRRRGSSELLEGIEIAKDGRLVLVPGIGAVFDDLAVQFLYRGARRHRPDIGHVILEAGEDAGAVLGKSCPGAIERIRHQRQERSCGLMGVAHPLRRLDVIDLRLGDAGDQLDQLGGGQLFVLECGDEGPWLLPGL